MKTRILIKIALILFITTHSYGQNQSSKLVGKITDAVGMGLPFVTVSIPELGKGTISNEEGEFELNIKPENFDKKIKFEMMGFKNSLLSVNEFQKLSNRTLIMKESGAEELEEVLIEQDHVVGEKAIENLKNNLIPKKHKIAGVYKRATIENNKAAHLIEHLVYAEDKAGYSEYSKVKIVGARESLDYRKKKFQQRKHAIYYSNLSNPLRSDKNTLKKIKWKRIDDTEIDDKYISILEGKSDKYQNIKLYVDPKEYKVYQVEYKTNTMNYLAKYKTNQDSKMYLSYNRRIYGWKKLKEFNPKAPDKTNGIIYKHEFITLKIKEKDYKRFMSTIGTHKQDITAVNVPYREKLWNSLSLPPDSEFYKKVKNDLISFKNIPLNKQYKQSNFARYKFKELVAKAQRSN